MSGRHYSILGKKINDDFINEFLDEGLSYDSKKVWLTFSLENFEGKGSYISKLKKLSRGRLIITKKRVIAIASNYKLVDIPNSADYKSKIVFDRSNPKRFIIEMDFSQFPSGYTGLMRLSYHVSSSEIII